MPMSYLQLLLNFVYNEVPFNHFNISEISGHENIIINLLRNGDSNLESFPECLKVNSCNVGNDKKSQLE